MAPGTHWFRPRSIASWNRTVPHVLQRRWRLQLVAHYQPSQSVKRPQLVNSPVAPVLALHLLWHQFLHCLRFIWPDTKMSGNESERKPLDFFWSHKYQGRYSHSVETETGPIGPHFSDRYLVSHCVLWESVHLHDSNDTDVVNEWSKHVGMVAPNVTNNITGLKLVPMAIRRISPSKACHAAQNSVAKGLTSLRGLFWDIPHSIFI